MIRDEPCIQTYRAAVEEFAHLEVVTPESQSTLSGAAGFAVAPIAYKLGDEGFLLDDDIVESTSPGYLVQLWGDAKKRAENGRIRIVVTDSMNSIYSEPSAPITFSMPDGVYSNVDPAVTALLKSSSPQAWPSPSPQAWPSPSPQAWPSPLPVDPEAVYEIGEDMDSAEEKRDGKCASLRPEGKFTRQALGRVAGEHKTTIVRRPDPYGGQVPDPAPFLQPCEVQHSFDENDCVESPIGNFESWMLPVNMNLTYDSEDVMLAVPKDFSLTAPSFTAVDGTVASFFARVFRTMTNFSFVGCEDPADTACHETDFARYFDFVIKAKWFGDGNLFNNTPAFEHSAALEENGFNKLFPGKDLPLPAIRMRAVDAAGNGVPGLRVRLNVFDSIYPNMPPVARVVTCSLLKGEEGEIPAEKAVPIEGMAPNEVLEMKRDGQLVCETDKHGYVNMRVSHPLETSAEPRLEEERKNRFKSTCQSISNPPRRALSSTSTPRTARCT